MSMKKDKLGPKNIRGDNSRETISSAGLGLCPLGFDS